MNLDEKKAKNFAFKILSKKFKGIELKWIMEHCREVLNCCSMLSKEKDVEVINLRIAAWVHDIGRVISEEEHPRKSLELLKKEFGEINEKIEDCILNHQVLGTPKTKEGKIFQVADKMSLLSPKLFVLYAKEDKEGAINFFRKEIDKFFELSKKFDFN